MAEEPDWVKRVREAETLPQPMWEGGLFATFDLLGRKNPRRLGLPDYLLVIARSEPGRVRRVPQGAIVEEDDADVFVACPCGARPIVEEQQLAECPGGCGRNYVRVDSMVFVAYAGEVPPLVRSAS